MRGKRKRGHRERRESEGVRRMGKRGVEMKVEREREGGSGLKASVACATGADSSCEACLHRADRP